MILGNFLPFTPDDAPISKQPKTWQGTPNSKFYWPSHVATVFYENIIFVGNTLDIRPRSLSGCLGHIFLFAGLPAAALYSLDHQYPPYTSCTQQGLDITNISFHRVPKFVTKFFNKRCWSKFSAKEQYNRLKCIKVRWWTSSITQLLIGSKLNWPILSSFSYIFYTFTAF